MKMIQCEGSFSFDIAAVSDEDLNAEFRRRKELVFKLKGEWQDSLEEKEACDFTVGQLRQALFEKGAEAAPWAPEVYRMVAEGRIDDALHTMHSEVPELAPPSHERAVADLLSYGRA